MFSKHKKPQLQVIALSKTISKANICLSQGDPSHHSSSKEPSKILRKDMSSKNLKLGPSCSSNEFPAILAKSVSQTTMHRKMDENKLKLLEKIGGKRRSEKENEGLSIHRFKLGKKLGSGRFGNVYLAE